MDSEFEDAEITSDNQGCFARLRGEFAIGPFELTDANGKVIDVQRTFAAKPFYAILTIKLIFTGLCLDTLFRDLILYNDDTRYFYLSYLTHWALLISEIYIVLSLVTTLLPITTEQPVRGMPPNSMVKLTWAFFSLASTMEAFVTLLYWYLEYQPGMEVGYFGYMKHGGVCVIILLEGLLVNRVPMRMHHIRYPIIVATIYITWNIIHGLWTDIGNPNSTGDDNQDDEADDDAIYASLNWEERPLYAAIVSFLSIFVLTPLLFTAVYLLSLPLRRYINDDPSSLRSTSSIFEMRRKKEGKRQEIADEC